MIRGDIVDDADADADADADNDRDDYKNNGIQAKDFVVRND